MLDKLEFLDALENKSLLQSTFEIIAGPASPNFSSKLIHSGGFCGRKYESGRGISSCVASELAELAIYDYATDKNKMKNEIKGRIKEAGGVDKFMDKIHKNIIDSVKKQQMQDFIVVVEEG